jgi:hypothetical protein
LKAEIGDSARIVYEKPWEDPDRAHEERREVHADGTLVLLQKIRDVPMAFGQMVATIVSCGQTGADRAALDWAIARGIDHGGWCTKGRKAEDGVIDSRNKLRELDSPAYRARTRQNVIDSDGTLILNIGELSDGTLETRLFAERLGKPYLVVQLEAAGDGESVRPFLDWLGRNPILVLNVAGPRESKRPGICAKVRDFLDKLEYGTAPGTRFGTARLLSLPGLKHPPPKR